MNTRLQYMEELTRLHHDILTMGTRVEEDLRKALEALRTGNVDLAREVKAGDEVVNALQVKIDDQTAMLIATQQPVAGDLRELVTVFKVTDNLERIGDHAVHLAKTARKLSEKPFGLSVERLERMADTGCAMVRDAVTAFLNKDLALAESTARRDDEIDANHKAFVNEVLEYLTKNPEKTPQGTKLISTSSFLERLGDHVTNLCEAIVFMIDGRHVELNE